MKIHINYAHGRYIGSQQHCCKTALGSGGFDRSIPHGMSDIDPAFIQSNQYTFSQPRGAGFWLWKPYLILKTMTAMATEDWLMYTDSGMYFVKNPWDYILANETQIGERGLVAFGKCGLNRQYTKRDTFVLMGLDEPKYTDSEQITAAVFVCRNTSFAVHFVQEWLRYATDPRILTDLPNTQRKQNYPEFRDHRHDQSIMSLMCIKHNVPVLSDITQFGMPNDPYMIHTRNPS
jgi:hypothetical protein